MWGFLNINLAEIFLADRHVMQFLPGEDNKEKVKGMKGNEELDNVSCDPWNNGWLAGDGMANGPVIVPIGGRPKSTLTQLTQSIRAL